MKRVTAFASSLAFILSVAIINIAGPITAHASTLFSLGDGTEVNPYRISNCDQLQAITDDLGAFYKLVVNIDCSGKSFVHIGEDSSPFTGSLEGNYKIIKNLTIDDFGLFGQITNGIVHNLKLDGTVINGTTNVGSLAGTVLDAGTNISNVHSVNATINGSSNYIGGLVGTIGLNNPVLENSSFVGSVSSPGVMGGFIGNASGGAYIHNNYARVTMTVGPNDSPTVGGFFGLAGASQTANNYAISTIDAVQSGFSSMVGGFAGLGTGRVESSFADMTYNSGANEVGDFLGRASGLTINANYYADHGHSCASNTSGAGGCTAVDTTANPNYFKAASNAPYIYGWDFENTWEEVDGDYPRLRNEAAFSETSDDINGDSINDTYQANVIGVRDSESILTTVELNSDTNCTLDPAGSWTDAGYYKADPDFPLQIPHMTAFTVYCPTDGAQVLVTLIYPDKYDTSNSVLRFYDDVANSYHNVAGVVFGTRTVNGKEVTTATYTLVDGGVNDTDSTPNGVIQDPVGIAVNNSPKNQTTPSTNSNGGTLAKTGQDIQPALLVGVLLATSTLATTLFRRRHVYTLRSK